MPFVNNSEAPSWPELEAAQTAYTAAVAADPNGNDPSLWLQATKDAAREVQRCLNMVGTELVGIGVLPGVVPVA
jgi:hypothetical protein